MENKLIIGRVYKHFKGDYYLVENTAIDSESGKEMVIYRKLYENGELYVREKDMFLSEVDKNKYPNATQHFRFELQHINSVKK